MFFGSNDTSNISNMISNVKHHSIVSLLYLIIPGSRNKPLGVSREPPELPDEINYDHTCNNIANV